jgi:hypothetical protein
MKLNKPVVLVCLILFLSHFFGCSSDSSSSHSSARNCSNNINALFTFAVIGDYGIDGKAEAAVADLVKSWDPDIIITTGDNNYPQGSSVTIDHNIGKYYHNFIKPYAGAYGTESDINRFFPVLGNHDWITSGGAPYFNYFALPNNERYYDFMWGNVHFFALDSDPNEPDGVSSSSAQAQWLENALASSTSPFKFVYMHHAPYSSGRHGPITYMQWPYNVWGVDAVISGHDHTYERLAVNGIPYFVNGLGGASIYDFSDPLSESLKRYNSKHGAMQIDVEADRVVFRFCSVDNELIDEHIVSK